MVQQKKWTDIGNSVCGDQPVNKHIPHFDISPFDTCIWSFQILFVKFFLSSCVALDPCQKVRLIYVKAGEWHCLPGTGYSVGLAPVKWI